MGLHERLTPVLGFVCRYICSALAAVYTTGYLHGFLGAFSPTDGPMRFLILFYLLLLLLPVTAVLEAFTILRCCARGAVEVSGLPFGRPCSPRCLVEMFVDSSYAYGCPVRLLSPWLREWGG
jgi:hypothetical protein